MWFWVRVLGRVGSVLGRFGVFLVPSWDVLGRLGRIFLPWLALRFWMVLDSLDGLLTSFESMLARCLGMLRLSSRFAGFRRVSAERFPRCASTASRE